MATGLFVTAIASLAQLFALATRANAAAGEMTVATVLAAQKIEELRAAPYLSVAGGQSTDYVDSRGEAIAGANSARGRAYARHWWVAVHRPAALVSAASITVAVTVVVSRHRPGTGGWPGPGDVPGGTAPEEIVRVVTLRTEPTP